MRKILSLIAKLFTASISVPIAALLLIIVLSAIMTINIVRQDPERFGMLKGPSIIEEEEKALVAEVGKLISLPEGETPVIATVSDQDKLSDQPFFASAELGDKIIIYQQARKAILYRPSEKRIVEVGTVNIDQGGEVESIEKEEKASFVILNGTDTPGLTKVMEDDIIAIVPGAEIVKRANAASIDYQKTLVIDVAGENKELADELAEKLKAETSDLPDGEAEPGDVSFVIIVGEDRVPQETEQPSE
jgi:hypothetical protein